MKGTVSKTDCISNSNGTQMPQTSEVIKSLYERGLKAKQ